MEPRGGEPESPHCPPTMERTAGDVRLSSSARAAARGRSWPGVCAVERHGPLDAWWAPSGAQGDDWRASRLRPEARAGLKVSEAAVGQACGTWERGHRAGSGSAGSNRSRLGAAWMTAGRAETVAGAVDPRLDPCDSGPGSRWRRPRCADGRASPSPWVPRTRRREAACARGKVQHETTARDHRDRLAGRLRRSDGGGLLGREGVHGLVRPGRPAHDDRLAVGEAHHRGVPAAAGDGPQRPAAGCGGDWRGRGRGRPRRPRLRRRRRVRPDPAEPAHRPVAQRAADAAGHRPRAHRRGRRPRPGGAAAPWPSVRPATSSSSPACPRPFARLDPRRAGGRGAPGAPRETAQSYPSRPRPRRKATGAVILYLFPRDDAITLADEEVEFVTEIAEASIERTFELEDMVFNGRLEL